MWNYYNNRAAVQNELLSDLWIERNVPGGLHSPLGQALDNAMGGNPNPTPGQMMYPYGGYSYGYGYNRY